MGGAVLGVLVGLASGFLSGQFGIGGGLITTPAIRLLLDRPALIAVGTPLPVIVPTAIVGALSYSRSGLADVRGGLIVGAAGAAAAVPGALATRATGGRFVLIVTAMLIWYMAVDMMLLALRGRARGPEGTAEAVADEGFAGEVGQRGTSPAANAGHDGRLALLGLGAGVYSGFLGLGGGFVIVPVLSRWFRYPIKRAIGTSLVAISLIAIPGSVTHYLLGNVDARLTLLLVAGVVPGALLGARVTKASRERTVQLLFALLLLVTGGVLVLTETGLL